MPRWVPAIKSPHPRCRVCRHTHAPGDWHRGSPDDWSPPANPGEERQRALELFVREFGPCSEPHIVAFLANAERRIRRESPAIIFPELMKRVGDAMRAAGFGRS